MEFEIDVIPRIKDCAEYFRPVREGVYLTKCWVCGDSNKQNHAHMYLFPEGGRCGYYCHKCNAKGTITSDILEQLIGKNDFVLDTKTIRRINPSNPNNIVETDILNKHSKEYQYLAWRLGCDFTDEELYKFRIIADQYAFIAKYNIKNINPIPNSILFLSADGNVLCWRNLTENDEMRWFKQKVFPKYNTCPYTIRGSFDVLETKPQTILIAEGIMDIIGIYKHLTQNGDLYIAALGKKYSSVFDWLISKGFFGKNIDIQIYSDQDVDHRDIKKDVVRYRWMFGHISVIYNDASKDFGVPAEEIILRDPIFL